MFWNASAVGMHLEFSWSILRDLLPSRDVATRRATHTQRTAGRLVAWLRWPASGVMPQLPEQTRAHGVEASPRIHEALGRRGARAGYSTAQAGLAAHVAKHVAPHHAQRSRDLLLDCGREHLGGASQGGGVEPVRGRTERKGSEEGTLAAVAC